MEVNKENSTYTSLISESANLCTARVITGLITWEGRRRGRERQRETEGEREREIEIVVWHSLGYSWWGKALGHFTENKFTQSPSNEGSIPLSIIIIFIIIISALSVHHFEHCTKFLICTVFSSSLPSSKLASRLYFYNILQMRKLRHQEVKGLD